MGQQTNNGFGLTKLRVAAGLMLVAGVAVLSSGQTWAQAQLPPGFYSFAPSKQELPVGQLSSQAQADLNAALVAYRAKDFSASLPYLDLPSSEGSIQANWLLAHMFRKGLGVSADQVTAFKHYNRVAEDYVDSRSEVSGNERYFVLDSLTRMANYLRTGHKKAGVRKNVSKALHYYQTAASAGHAGAQYGFGLMYLNGEGVARDRSYGMRWLGTAAQKRYAPAAALLGDIYNESGDKVRALVWYKIAADTAGASLNRRIVKKTNAVVSEISQKKLGEANNLYTRWSSRFPVRTRQAQN
ncbi:MAG: sel1 repeat family protein [Anderseniella sp.]|jgi:TPR repeat protein|nr:sel1 repeat family protein [Anderseniella sp.]